MKNENGFSLAIARQPFPTRYTKPFPERSGEGVSSTLSQGTSTQEKKGKEIGH